MSRTLLLLLAAVVSCLVAVHGQANTTEPACGSLCLHTQLTQQQSLAPGVKEGDIGTLCGVPAFVAAFNACLDQTCSPNDAQVSRGFEATICAAAINAAGASNNSTVSGSESSTVAASSAETALPTTPSTSVGSAASSSSSSASALATATSSASATGAVGSAVPAPSKSAAMPMHVVSAALFLPLILLV